MGVQNITFGDDFGGEWGRGGSVWADTWAKRSWKVLGGFGMAPGAWKCNILMNIYKFWTNFDKCWTIFPYIPYMFLIASFQLALPMC